MDEVDEGDRSFQTARTVRALDKPLPGDLVIRLRVDGDGIRRSATYVITTWPDAETVVAGPYQSYSYALQQAQRHIRDRSEFIWRDHARSGELEQLEQVSVTDGR